MAKTGFWLRGAKGKLAGTTMYRGRKGTIQREIVNPRNPKSTAQMLQRIAFSTVARTAAALKGIVDHSFEGIPYGAQSSELFKKLAIADLKSALIDPRIVGGNPYAPVLPIGTLPRTGIAALDGFLISRGSLPSYSFSLENFIHHSEPYATANMGIKLENSTTDATLTNLTYANISKLGLDITCQHTIIFFAQSSVTVNEKQFFCAQPIVARINFKQPDEIDDDTTKVFVSGTDTEGETAIRLNPDVLKLDESDNWEYLEFELYNISEDDTPEYEGCVMGIGEPDLGNVFAANNVRGAAVIKSKKVNGEWLRSTQYVQTVFVSDPNEIQITQGRLMNNITDVLNAASGEGSYPSDWYLNKAQNPL